MIPVRCFTNIDEYQKVEWPNALIVRPIVGDYVEGIFGSRRPRLRVIAVTHAIRIDNDPYLLVELHR